MITHVRERAYLSNHRILNKHGQIERLVCCLTPSFTCKAVCKSFMRNPRDAHREPVANEWITTFRIQRPIPYTPAYRFIVPFWISRLMNCRAERDRMYVYHPTISLIGSARVFLKKNSGGVRTYNVLLQCEHNSRIVTVGDKVYWKYLMFVSFLRINDVPIRTDDSVRFIRDTIGFCGKCPFCKSIYRTVVNRSTYKSSPRLANQMRSMPFIEQRNCEFKLPAPELIPTDLSPDISSLP